MLLVNTKLPRVLDIDLKSFYRYENIVKHLPVFFTHLPLLLNTYQYFLHIYQDFLDTYEYFNTLTSFLDTY